MFKGGQHDDRSNYRPISALPVVSRLFEKLIYDQLYHYLDKNRYLVSHQSGFRSLHSVVTCLLKATNDWYSKVPPLRNCIRRNSGLISLNKIPLYKKLSKLIHVQFLLQWYIVIFYWIYLNMSAEGLISQEIRMKVLSQDCYSFKNLSVLSQTNRSLNNSPYFKMLS